MKIAYSSYLRKLIWVKKYIFAWEKWQQLWKNLFSSIFLLMKILEKYSRSRKFKNAGRLFVICLFLDEKIQEKIKKR